MQAHRWTTPAGLPAHPLGYLWRHRRMVIVGVICLLLTNALAQVIPWIVKHTIESMSSQRGSESAQRLAWFALMITALAISQAFIRIVSRIMVFNAGRQAEYELRSGIYAHLCELDEGFYRRYRTGDLMSRLTNDLAAVRSLFGPGVLHASNTVFAYAIALPLMINIDPWLTLWALLPSPVLLLGARGFARGVYQRSRAQQRALASMTAAIQEDLAGIRELKSYRLEQRRHEAFSIASDNYLHQALRHAAWRAGMLPFVGLGAGTSVALILLIGGRQVVNGNLTLGDLVALNMYVGLLAWPTMALGWMISLWQAGVSAWHRLCEILATKPALADALPGPQPRDASITTRQLSFSAGSRKILSDVSISVASGTICAVVGKVGSGKTTLAEVVARLRVIAPESLFIGGVDVTQLPLSDVRRKIAYAPQDAFLFSQSISENVALGIDPAESLTPNERRSRIAESVSIAGLDPDLDALPDGVQTVVGERGVSLSGGQRQRVALARALVARRPILILDDALSAVDAETERRIIARLRGTLSDTTTLLTSHRLSALQHADQVVVLDQGRVVEKGTHAQLLLNKGLYARLYRRQLLQPDLAADLPQDL